MLDLISGRPELPEELLGKEKVPGSNPGVGSSPVSESDVAATPMAIKTTECLTSRRGVSTRWTPEREVDSRRWRTRQSSATVRDYILGVETCCDVCLLPPAASH